MESTDEDSVVIRTSDASTQAEPPQRLILLLFAVSIHKSPTANAVGVVPWIKVFIFSFAVFCAAFAAFCAVFAAVCAAFAPLCAVVIDTP